MSFETLYEKYMNGTASEEERVYVEEEIAKARKLGEILEAAEKDKAKSASDRKSTRLNSSHVKRYRMPSSA